MDSVVNSSNPFSLMTHFKDVEDYRVERTKKYELIEIMMIAICASIASANDWVDVAAWGEANQDWLKKFLELRHGTPSHDTFSRVFGRINPNSFLNCFISWTNQISKVIHGKVVAIDGKTVRRSYDTSSDEAAIHLVSAWASEFQLTLGQVKTEEKSNEITAIPELLKLLDLKGCIVTIDAMGCQKSIAKDIIDQNADYMLALKKNHGDLYELVTFFFDEAKKNAYKDLKHTSTTSVEKDHGRIERRTITATEKIDSLVSKYDWKGIKSIIRVDSERTVKGLKACSTRYFLTSLPADAEKASQVIRAHWGIESMHWSLDVTFDEDNSRVRKRNGPQNLALLRRLTFNLLRCDNTTKDSVKTKRFRACFDRSYLEKVLCI